MTLLVITKDRVITDSFEGVGDLQFNIENRKVRTHRTIPGKFFVAGYVPDLRIMIGTLTTKEELLASTFPCDSSDHTVVAWVLDGTVWIMECSKGSRWFELDRTSDICYMAGAGWRWFEAFYADKGNVDDAFKRVCELHQYCKLPANSVRIDGN